RMLELALASTRELAIDRREIQDVEPSYTVRTLEALKRDAPDEEVFFIIGGDSLHDLPQWHRIESLAALTTFLVGVPSGHDVAAAAREARRRVPSLRLSIIEGEVLEVSSSEIRRRVAAGAAIDGLVAPEVGRYIAARGLYRGDDPAR